MFTHNVPIFEKGRVLKTGMLDMLRDYPLNFLDIHYQYYSDGIIAGAEVIVDDERLTVSRGIVKYDGRMYLLEQDYQVRYEATGRETFLKIRFYPEERDSDYYRSLSEIVLSEEASQPNELELTRFKLKEGARLRLDYTSFEDMATEYNTLNLIHRQHAGRTRHTLSPVVTRYFATELLKSGTTDPYDVSCAMQCLNESAVDRELIELYAANRLRSEHKPYDNGQLHRMLGRILNEAAAGGRTRPEMRLGGTRRLLVD